MWRALPRSGGAIADRDPIVLGTDYSISSVCVRYCNANGVARGGYTERATASTQQLPGYAIHVSNILKQKCRSARNRQNQCVCHATRARDDPPRGARELPAVLRC